MTVFWKTQPLNEKELGLLKAVFHAHSLSAQRPNMSSQALLLAHAGSGDYVKSLAAALLTLGNTHAPIEQTQRLLGHPNWVDALLAAGKKVPGWGNSFAKGEPDLVWREVERLLSVDFPEAWAKVEAVTASLRSRDLHLFPNPSAYTAAAAIALGLPAHCAAYLFIGGRLECWTAMVMAATNGRLGDPSLPNERKF